MSYRSYQGASSPWSSGVPPGAPPPAMYGHPHHNASHQHHGPPGYNVGSNAYGSPNAPWAGRHPMGHSGWGQSNPSGHTMATNQRGNMRTNIGGPTGKRAGNTTGNWSEGVSAKRMNKSNAANRNTGGTWRGPGFGNRRDNQKFGNRNQNKDNKRFRDGKGRVDQTEKKLQHELARKAVDSLDNKEYPLFAMDDGSAFKDEDKPKLQELDASHKTYVVGVFGFCCKLCNIFLRDKVSRFEHYQQEAHLEKFNAAEEVRIREEKEEAERKAKEAEEKANQEAAATETTAEGGENCTEDDKNQSDDQLNGQMETSNNNLEEGDAQLQSEAVNLNENVSENKPDNIGGTVSLGKVNPNNEQEMMTTEEADPSALGDQDTAEDNSTAITEVDPNAKGQNMTISPSARGGRANRGARGRLRGGKARGGGGGRGKR